METDTAIQQDNNISFITQADTPLTYSQIAQRHVPILENIQNLEQNNLINEWIQEINNNTKKEIDRVFDVHYRAMTK